MNIGEIARKAAVFREHLDEVKRGLGPQGFEWYRYNSLANFTHLDRLLTGERRDLLSLAAGRPILDIGCADGDLAFFLESLGCDVVAVDYPGTNHNTMLGVHALKKALQSKVEIISADVDSQFTLPDRDFGLAFVLGVLYHLKNPLYLLETVSRRARNSILSTRLARRVPGIAEPVGDVSVAYLLGATELNRDNSNYWIFTPASFRQMLQRTNWRLQDFMTVGDTESSDPVTTERDERVFCVAESRYALANVELGAGWHGAEERGWRWTKREFTVRVRIPVSQSRARLIMKLYLPPVLGRVQLTATVDGASTPTEAFAEPGYHDFIRDLGAADGRTVEIAFALDRAIPPDSADDRERGIIVHALEVI